MNTKLVRFFSGENNFITILNKLCFFFFNILGDEVWGATFPSSQGSHADFVTASTLTIAKVCDQGLR